MKRLLLLTFIFALVGCSAKTEDSTTSKTKEKQTEVQTKDKDTFIQTDTIEGDLVVKTDRYHYNVDITIPKGMYDGTEDEDVLFYSDLFFMSLKTTEKQDTIEWRLNDHLESDENTITDLAGGIQTMSVNGRTLYYVVHKTDYPDFPERSETLHIIGYMVLSDKLMCHFNGKFVEDKLSVLLGEENVTGDTLADAETLLKLTATGIGAVRKK